METKKTKKFQWRQKKQKNFNGDKKFQWRQKISMETKNFNGDKKNKRPIMHTSKNFKNFKNPYHGT